MPPPDPSRDEHHEEQTSNGPDRLIPPIDRRSFLAATTAFGIAALTPGRAIAARYQDHDGIKGLVENGWERVADIVRANLKSGRDLGASCCVYVDGHPVVDIWGGIADGATKRPWTRDTVAFVASTTKGASAMCAHLLVQRGQLDLDAPVTRYWPEFGQAGKKNVPVRYLLSHQVGLPYLDRQVSFQDACAWDPVVRALELQKPVWTPGTEHLYHAHSYGFLVGEVVRRVTGKTLGTFFQEEFARPLRLSAWIGLPEEIEPRIAPLDMPDFSARTMDEMAAEFGERMKLDPATASALVKAQWGPGSALSKVATVGGGTPEDYQSRAFRAAEFPSGNMFTNAESIARLYAATVGRVDGIRLLDPETVAAMTVLQTDRSRMHGLPPELLPAAKDLFRMSLGFWRPSAVNPMLGPASFGHAGSGGSLGAADPESRVAFGYVPNRTIATLIDPRAGELTAAVRKCLGKA